METLEMADIQGYIVRGYKHMMFSRYVMLHVTDATAAKRFIASIADSITNVTHFPKTNCLNIAFTSAGLRALGMKESNVKNFSREFSEGMTTPHRQRLLADFDSSDPQKWRWGGPNNEEPHILLMVFGSDEATALSYYKELEQQFTAAGLKDVFQVDGLTLPFNKEHFGFRDGISQPIIKGSGRKGPEEDYINAGEFIMGYKNEYNVYPDTPVLAEDQGEVAMLPLDAMGSGKKDLGRNGSYMVMRQLQQDVEAYWTFMNEKTKNEDGSVNVDESTKLASKMMGRWPSGAPLVRFPDKDPCGENKDDDYYTQFFTYQDNDKEGLKCPFGSHIRRTNPRDNFEDNGQKQSWKLTKRHRIIRRARLYGCPIAGSPTNFIPETEVGLMFTCFNSDISKQFEFISYTWANYPKFLQLYNDPDPITGIRETPIPGTEQNFTIPDTPVNKYITGMKSFVTTRGGAYFFFPSITTLKYLTTI
jgi:Dyp-type peroxidase family